MAMVLETINQSLPGKDGIIWRKPKNFNEDVVESLSELQNVWISGGNGINNTQAISLTSMFCKLFERTVLTTPA